jgi:tetratricopeptide (TPR) repeat protein
MTTFNLFKRQVLLLLGAFLLFSSTAYADDMQDASQLFKQGKYAPALVKVNNFLANSPHNAQARFLKGLILTEQGKTKDAIKAFTALTKDYPELPEPYNNLAVLYASAKHYNEAKNALEMAIRTHPSYATAHENLGDIYAKMASQAYNRALQLDRGNTATKTKLSMIQDLFAGNTYSAPIRTPKKPTPSGKPAKTTVAAVTPASNNKAASDKNTSQVLNMVNTWAAAWSSQNVEQYLSHYASSFKMPNGKSRADWEALRNKRLSTPKFIKVAVINPRVDFKDGHHATVKFKQAYHASHLKLSSKKTLSIVKSDGKWLIQRERSN